MYTLRIYSPEAFEWDRAKQSSNLGKHGVDFKDAVRVFERPVFEREDRRREYGEVRFVALGAVEDDVGRCGLHTAWVSVSRNFGSKGQSA